MNITSNENEWYTWINNFVRILIMKERIASKKLKKNLIFKNEIVQISYISNLAVIVKDDLFSAFILKKKTYLILIQWTI